MIRGGTAILGTALALAFTLCVFAEDKAAEQLEKQYAQESNPKKQVSVALDLVSARMNQLRSAYKAGDSDQEKQGRERYLAAIDLVATAVRKSANAGTSKRAEMHLRQQKRDLENLKLDVSYEERPEIDIMVAQVGRVQEQILYSVMNPHQEAAN